MTNTPGQVTIKGEIVSGLKLQIAALVLDTIPQGMTWEDIAEQGYLDRIRAEVEFVVDKTPAGAGKIDGETGDETGAPVGVISWRPIREGFKVTAILKRDEREAAWNQAHGVA